MSLMCHIESVGETLHTFLNACLSSYRYLKWDEQKHQVCAQLMQSISKDDLFLF